MFLFRVVESVLKKLLTQIRSNKCVGLKSIDLFVHKKLLGFSSHVTITCLFLLICYSYHVPYVYMADWAIAQGHPEEDASFLLSIVGILNTLGEVN